MIRIIIKPGVDRKWTVNMADGRNGKVFVSSTSQGYDRLSRAEEIARRIAPRGDEAVELVIKDVPDRVIRREMLHDPVPTITDPKVIVIAKSRYRASHLATELGLERSIHLGRRMLPDAGRGHTGVSAILIDDTADTLPAEAIDDVRPCLAEGGQVYRLGRVE
ncbi:hypothetical protein [Mycobacterium aquaticum]|uniref:Uncharacterized protein n=1 Tax=Mycobacterium aquaticum TaxID=1927124 RepID=A0A1X0A4B4_9MYCO|nr:hypothetical protein [Mycobacterium aquaticum]ORA24931.1 hypothetical protein BST13_33730 [Mycobacterium aquaticum]